MVRRPRLRTVEKYKPPYPLNKFPAGCALNLAREVVYLLASRANSRLEGTDWEEIFANIVGARWKPSNVGLDDIVLQQTAWGAKTVKYPQPSKANKVRLISGRNSPIYSFGTRETTNCEPNNIGQQVLAIWNERVAGVRQRYQHLRTIVLIKGKGLLELAVFETDTVLYAIEDYQWEWNTRENLVGFRKSDGEHAFTWQPHGSQFTIVEKVPKNRLALRIKKPPVIDKEGFLASLQFDESWIEVLS